MTFAQYTTNTGVNVSGINLNQDNYSYEKSQGLIAGWRADRGVVLNQVNGSTTNVQSWLDQSGNGYHLTQYVNTNQPAFYSSFSTNNFPCIFFPPGRISGGTGGIHMRCDPLATFFSGNNKPVTFVLLANSQTNALNTTAAGFGWSSASNNSSSILGIHVNANTATTHGLTISSDTNQSVITSVNVSGVFGTNVFYITCGSFDGVQGTCYENLLPGTVNLQANQGQKTLNTFTVGMIKGTNSTSIRRTILYVTEFQVYTNSIAGNIYTNIANNIKSRWSVYGPLY